MIEDTSFPGGILGGGPSKYNLRLAQQAFENDYPITPEMRKLIVTQAALIVGTAKNKRTRLAAMKVLLAADKYNLARRALDEGHASGNNPNPITVNLIEQIVVKQQEEAKPPLPCITEQVVESTNGRHD